MWQINMAMKQFAHTFRLVSHFQCHYCHVFFTWETCRNPVELVSYFLILTEIVVSFAWFLVHGQNKLLHKLTIFNTLRTTEFWYCLCFNHPKVVKVFCSSTVWSNDGFDMYYRWNRFWDRFQTKLPIVSQFGYCHQGVHPRKLTWNLSKITKLTRIS